MHGWNDTWVSGLFLQVKIGSERKLRRNDVSGNLKSISILCVVGEAREPKCLVEGKRSVETASVLAGCRTAGNCMKPNLDCVLCVKSMLH